MKTKISDILQEKKGRIVSVGPTSTVFESIKLMSGNKIGAVLVMEEDRILGIFTERDYMTKVILADHSSKELAIKEVMTSKVAFITPDTLIEEGMAVMTEKHCRHLPVLENKKLVGLVSMGDLVKRIISEQKKLISHLTKYIELSY